MRKDIWIIVIIIMLFAIGLKIKVDTNTILEKIDQQTDFIAQLSEITVCK